MAWSGRIDPPHLRSGVYMVYVAQLAECLIVGQEVMGSTPIIHTTYPRSSMDENLWLRTIRWEFESLRGYKR